MTTDDEKLQAEYQAERAFGETEVGKLLRAYESALGRAWVIDCSDSASDRKLREAWERSNAARRALVAKLRGMKD